MGIMTNFKKISEYQRDKNLESKIKKDLIKQSIDENTFYEEYSSFVMGLRGKLNQLMIEGDYKLVSLKVTERKNMKYFERVMEDAKFTSVYNIRRTSGGEYEFSQKSIADTAKEYGVDDL